MSGIINRSVLEGLQTQAQAVVKSAFERAAGGAYSFFTEVDSIDTVISEIGSMSNVPVVRRLNGQRDVESMRAFLSSYELETWHASIALDRKAVQYDRVGLVNSRIAELGRAAESAMDKIAHEALFGNPTAFDAAALFSASHPFGPSGGNQSNTSTTALSHAQHAAMMRQAALLQDEQGEPLSVNFTHLIVGPKLEQLAMEILQADTRPVALANDGLEAGTRVAATSIKNVYQGTLTLVVDKRFAGTYDDYYLYVDENNKPLRMRVGEAFQVIAQDQRNSSSVFDKDMIQLALQADIATGANISWVGGLLGIL